MRSKIKGLVVAGVTAALAAVGGVGPAHAISAGDYTSCGHGDGTLCIYYNSYDKGSHVGIYGEVDNYGLIAYTCPSDGCLPYRFITSGTGYGDVVKNDAASVYNEADWTAYWVYYNSNLQGPYDEWDPMGYGTYYGELNVTYNENASQNCQCTL